MEAEMKMALQPPRDLRAETCRLVIWGLVLAMLAWAWRGAEMKPMALVEQGGNILTLISDFFPPDFTDWRMYVEEMIVTLHVAIWGTLLAVICAVPLGIMSSENIAPWWICQPVRRLMDAARAINEMVFAMMFVVAVGLGPFAGVLALWVHTTGTLAKLFSEAVEAIEVSPVEGVRSTGASFLEEIIFGVIPQVFPLWISDSLYRFEANVRSATVVGMVGAGGIGRAAAGRKKKRKCHGKRKTKSVLPLGVLGAFKAPAHLGAALRAGGLEQRIQSLRSGVLPLGRGDGRGSPGQSPRARRGVDREVAVHEGELGDVL